MSHPTNYRWAERQLKPCPFCGERRIQILPQPCRWWLVKCTECPARMMILTGYQRQLIATWNYRAEPTPPATDPEV